MSSSSGNWQQQYWREQPQPMCAIERMGFSMYVLFWVGDSGFLLTGLQQEPPFPKSPLFHPNLP